MTEQLTLELAPLVVPDGGTDQTIQERFEAFHAANPWVLRAFIQLADDARQHGRQRVGIGMFAEVVRWQYGRRTSGDPFKINNDFRSRYVRLIAEQRPQPGRHVRDAEAEGGMSEWLERDIRFYQQEAVRFRTDADRLRDPNHAAHEARRLDREAKAAYWRWQALKAELRAIKDAVLREQEAQRLERGAEQWERLAAEHLTHRERREAGLFDEVTP